MSLPNNADFITCDSCHSGSGVGTPNHMNYVTEVVFLSAVQTTYKAESGITIAYDAASQTCSKISCHGGQTTPNWVFGSINVNGQCGACHVSGATEYNSYSSGEHNKHVNEEGIGCTECHDTARLATVHFNDLNTTAMTQSALTIIDAANYSGGNCSINCHGKNHSSESW
jgi:predicted CxxxxCH...CXXCH cytochrome family protein